MNEELLIKLKVDTSAVTTSINKVKNEVSNVNKTMEATSNTSGATQQSAQNAQQAAQKLSQSITKMIGGIKKLGQISSFTDVAEIGAELLAASVQTKAVKNSMEQVEKTTEATVDATEELVRELQKVVALSRQAGVKPETYARGGKSGGSVLDIDPLGSAEGAISKYSTGATKATAANSKFNASMGKVAATGAAAKASVSGVAGATSSAGSAASGAAASAGGLGAALGSVAAIAAALIPVFIALGTVIAGVFASLKVSKLGDEVYHSAQKFGFSTKAYQEWSWIMERNGSTIDDLTGFLETLASEQAAVVEGSEDAIANFKRLGLSMEDVVSMDQQKLFEETVRRIQGIEDATQRSAIAYSIFGDEASRLMNVLNMSNAEMQETINNYHLLGGSMSPQLTEQSNALQNSIANMKQAWQGISNTLAEVFIPVVKAVVDWITKALVIVNLFLRVIFGLDLKTKSAAGSVDKATASNKKYAGSLGAAKKAAEALKRVTMGFDELNVVQDPNKNAGSSSGGVGSMDMSNIPTLDDSMLNTDNLNLDKIYAWFEEYKEVIRQVVTWSLIGIGILLAVIGACTVNVPLIILGVGMAGLGIAVGVKSGAFESMIEGIKGVIKKMVDWFKENVAPMFTKEYWTEKWENIKTAAAEKLDEIGQKVFGEKWDGIKTWFKTNVAPVFTKQYWKTKFNEMKLGIESKIEEIKTGFSTKWNGIKSWFSTSVAPKFTKKYWANKFDAMKQGIKQKLDEIGDKLFGEKWSGIKNWFKKNVATKFTKTYWKEKFQSIPDGMKAAVNGLIGIVEKGVNFIIKQINKLSWKVPDWVPGIGGSKWGFNFKTITIPKLAEGGITTGSTIANIGENGREAVLPLENNTEWMDTLADKIAERNAAPTKVVLQVGEKELGWATINSINNITKQTGGIQLAL